MLFYFFGGIFLSACTFFGQQNSAPFCIGDLITAIADLIENKGVDTFYVGCQGDFDCYAREVLKGLSETHYPNIKITVVLAYPLTVSESEDGIDTFNTVLPEKLKGLERDEAIDERNKWMIEKSDYVVTYVNWIGEAYKYQEIARNEKKTVINIAKRKPTIINVFNIRI